ncbi:TonB-dependent receptor plug domain-containing protein [Sphingomonas sp. CJ20]
MTHRFWRTCGSRVSLAALAIAGLAAQAHAQTTPAPAAEEAAPSTDDSELVVTGSRIARDGFQSPTPLIVLTEEAIRAQSPSNNLADFVNQIPAVAGSIRPANSRLAISSGLAGINAISLRNLGTERTLVLLDGRRSVGSSITGAVDINDFPQSLVRSVEVVTGGASAAYGSDAVSGVVNFVLDRKYTGLKASAESGITDEGDGFNYAFSLAGGTSFAGGRGHLLLSGEYAHRDGIFQMDRDWNQTGYRTITNPAYTATNGQPQNLVVTRAGTYNQLPGGIITAATRRGGGAVTALNGTYFGPGGSINTYNFGSITNTTTTVGGDWQIADGQRRIGLDSSDDRRSLFGRLSFELADWIEVFGEASYAWHHSLFNAGPSLGTATLASDNAYLIQTLGQATLTNLNINTVTIGTSGGDLRYRKNDNTRDVQRYVFGGEGKFSALGSDIQWDGYVQYGVTKTHEVAADIMNTSRMALATDAVFAPAGNALGVAAGTIVCRSSLTNPTNGCIPLNRLGTGVANPAAVDYVLGDPQRYQTFKQTVAGLNFRLNPFATWAGPVSLAVGGEYRREEVSGSVETQYRTGWAVGNFLPTFGSYHVKEAYLETVVPLGLGLEFNGAVRGTDYSTSGYVTTWKGGLTWQPIDDIRLRFTRSRDIRAPNLNELYAAGTSRTNTLLDPFNNRASTQYLETTTGNPNLKAEVADSLNLGIVLQPRFLPGFSFSVDGFDIKVKDAIGQVRAEEILNRCYQGLQEYCAAFTRNPGGTPELSVSVSPFNFSNIHTRGLDFDASYRVPVTDDAAVTLRGMATYYDTNYTNNGIDAPVEAAGANGGGVPSWIYRASATLNAGDFAMTGTGRGVSSGTIANSYIVCTTGCPAATVANPTINENHMPGAIYFDLNLTQTIRVGSKQGQIFFTATNLFDRDPVLQPTTGLSTNANYYDVLGRTFRLGVRFEIK